MATVSYLQSHRLVANPPGQHRHVVDRPWVEVEAQWSGHRHRVWCLVDTGADDTVLDLGTAAVLGINHLSLPQVTVSTIGAPSGSGSGFGLQRGVQLDFAGASVTADVIFGVVSVPLLGRSALLAGVQAGFDVVAWHHT